MLSDAGRAGDRFALLLFSSPQQEERLCKSFVASPIGHGSVFDAIETPGLVRQPRDVELKVVIQGESGG